MQCVRQRSFTDDLPTARNTLQASYAGLLLTCRSCLRSRHTDLPHLIESRRGDVPVKVEGELNG